MSIIEKKSAQWIALVGCVVVALLVTPSTSSEPVDLPKMTALVIFAFPMFALTLKNISIFLRQKSFRVIFLLLSSFVFFLAIPFFFADSPWILQFFGAFGRNTGLLTYLALVLIFASGILVTSQEFTRKIYFAIFGTGIISTLYSILQLTKHDPIKWNNPYNAIIGFLGNPDFESSFLGISSVCAVALILKNKTKVTIRLGSIIYLAISAFVIKKSQAQQGLLVFGIGFAFMVLIYLYKSFPGKRKLVHAASIVSSLAGVTVLLGAFKLGPFANIIYKFSVRQRGFYWHAALRMMETHPLTGVGLDSYGDNYFRYRSANAAFHSMPTQSNAAHNVYLDFAASGGVFLLLAYIALNIYVAYAGFRLIRRSPKFDPYISSIFVMWIGYQAQSIISINQIGLAVWGWILGAVIVGLYLNNGAEKSGALPNEKSTRRRVSKKKIDWAYPSLAFLVALILVLPSFQADHNYRVATVSRNADAVIKAVSQYPEDTDRTLNAATLFVNSKLIPQAQKLVLHVLSINSKSYNAWFLLKEISPQGSEQFMRASKKLRELNPHDPSL
jgi:O-antigen ligase